MRIVFFVILSCGVWYEAPQNDIVQRNGNQYDNEYIIMFFAIFPCGVWLEAQQRYASTVISQT